MSVQKWIAEGLYSDSAVRRGASFVSKLVLEGIVFAAVGLFFALIAFTAQKFTPINIPQIPEAMSALWLLFAVVVGKHGYCFLTETR